MVSLCERVEISVTSDPKSMEHILKAITAGFFYHTAKLTKAGNYRTIKHNHMVHIHPQSTLFKEETPPKWLLYHELMFTTKEFMRQVIIIKPEWLVEIAPHYYRPKEIEDSSKKKM